MASEFSIANAIFSIATICASGLVGFLSAKHINTLNTHSQACASLRAALAPVCVELRRANGKPTVGLDSALSNTLHEVAVAFEVFAPFVLNSERTSYEIACQEYEDAAMLGSEFMYKDNRITEVKRRIENLLKHTTNL